MAQKMVKRLLIYAIFIAIVLIIGILLTSYFYNQIEDLNDSLSRCKDAGYDGIEFGSKSSNGVRCSNFSIEEEIARGIK